MKTSNNNSHEFASNLSTSEIVSRISSVITTKSSPLGKGMLRGGVDQKKVYLYRYTPLFGNIFKSVFSGEFSEQNGQTKLQGKFKMHWLGKAVSIVWFSGASVFFLVTIFSMDIEMIVYTGLFLLGGFLVVKFGVWVSRNDRSFIVSSLQQFFSQR